MMKLSQLFFRFRASMSVSVCAAILGLALVDVPAVAAVEEVVVVRGIGTGVLLTAADREDAQFLHEGGLLVDLCFREVAEGVALPLSGQSFQLIFLTGQELVGVIGTGIGGVNLVGEPGQHVDEHRASDETGRPCGRPGWNPGR